MNLVVRNATPISLRCEGCGDGARLRQIIAGVPTTYTQDLAASLPVVLQAKTGSAATQYLYSMGTRPIGQYTSAWEYLLPDALGSVRQIVDANGNVTLAESYEPYGSVLSSNGSASSIYGFTGEQTDGQTGLLFLRARYLQPRLGIFLARDPWSGDEMQPGSMNGFGYVEGNPINRVDPAGKYATFTEEEVNAVVALSPVFFDSASRHNMPGSNMNDGVFAALLVTMMRSEAAFNRFKSDLALQRTARFWDPLMDSVGLFVKNKSIGPGNMKKTTLQEILRGQVRKTSYWEELAGPREYFEFCLDYNLRSDQPINTGTEWAVLFGVPAEDAYALDLASTQDLEQAIDLGGALIQGGVMRMQLQGEQPYIFNLMMWWIQGVTSDSEINDIPAAARGPARIYAENILPEASSILKDTLPVLALAADALQSIGLTPLFVPTQSYDFSYELGPSYDRYVRERGGQ